MGIKILLPVPIGTVDLTQITASCLINKLSSCMQFEIISTFGLFVLSIGVPTQTKMISHSLIVEI